MTTMRMRCVAIGLALVACLGMAAETNILSFAYTASLAADESTPDTWLRKLNDGYWTNSAADGVRYNGDVTVTVDLGRRMRLDRVDVYTFSASGGSALSTQGVSLESSTDAATWIPLGVLPAAGSGLFSGNAFFANARYLRLTCAKGVSAVGQSLAEIVVTGGSAGTSGLSAFTYTTSMPYNPAHTDPTMMKLKDGLWGSAATQSVQYGPSSPSAVTNSDPAYCIASNVVVVTALGGARSLRSAHLYAYNSAGAFVTARVTISNSLDGVNWTCAGQQSVFESLPASCVRFDFILPNVNARYLAFACEKQASASFVRQLLAEIQVFETPAASQLGDPLAFTYEFSLAPSTSVDKPECPKLTDGAWDNVTRNAIRFYGNVAITADLGAPRYVAGTDLLCWSNKFSSGPGYYGTGRVVVNGSLDKANWTELATMTSWKPSWPYNHAVTFTNLPYARYLRLDAYLCEDISPAMTNTAQILGELVIYRPPAEVIGKLPVAVAGAIPFAGFETDPLIPEGDSAAMLVAGGVTNGWTFSYTNSANYTGFQRNNSSVSTNSFSTTRFLAPEGMQTAVMMGSGSMETQISVATNGSYVLQFQLNSTVFNINAECGGYDFIVRLDGVVKGVVTVAQLTNTMHQVFLPNVSAGAHTLRLEGVNSKGVAWGALIDDLKLKRFELAAEQVATQGRGFVLVADAMMPLALDYVGAILVKDLWVDGILLPPAKYSASTHPTVFEGPGFIRHDRGTFISIK